MDKFKLIGVYGGGSWGTALACQVARVQNAAHLFLRNEKIAEEILNNSTNSSYLDNIILPSNIYPTTSLEEFINKEIIIIAVPSISFSGALKRLKEANLSRDTILLIATKGLSDNPVELLSDKVKSFLPNKIAFISGPNFAREVAENLLTPVTIASEDLKLAEKIAASLKSKNFIPTISDDIVTAQVAGALKNIIAIKSGMNQALGYKENAKAGLITDGLKEIILLSKILGGKIETIVEPAVIGDLVLTSYSTTSRNTKFGYELALSSQPEQFLSRYPYLIEGVESVKLVIKLVKQYNLDLPIITSVAEALKLPF